MAGEKLDLYKLHREDYKAKPEPEIKKIAPANYLMIDGSGSPDGKDFPWKMGGLYGMAYTLKFASKTKGRDYVVSKLEGLWWVEEVEGFDFVSASKDDWQWRILIRTPDFITEADLAEAIEQLRTKKKEGPFEEVRVGILDEGEVVQALHIGPYSEETALIHRMHEYAEAQGYELTGLHHEIYLGDPRSTAPEKLKTILRHPVKKK